jgi:hypothetical protein
LKDMKLQVAHGRVATENGISVISVFVLRCDYPFIVFFS